MDDRKGHTRKLESAADTSAVAPRGAVGFPSVDSADNQIVDERAVLDVLDSGTFPVPDQLVSGDRDELGDDEKIDLTNTSIPYDRLTRKADFFDSLAELSSEDATSRLKVREAMAILEEATEGTTVLHRYQPEAARVSWVQRVLSWFGGD